MLIAFQYKLYPTPEQERVLLDTLETCRHLYNNALAERIDAYNHEGRTIGYGRQANQLPVLKKKAPALLQPHSQVVQDCLRRLQKAYDNFFRRVQEGEEEPGFPRFKGIGRYRSLTYPHWGRGVSLEANILHLSKIGDITVRLLGGCSPTTR
jgi:putative transposase